MRNEDIREGIWAGLIGGVVFMMSQMLMTGIFLGAGIWVPVNMIAGIVLGPYAVFPLYAFDPVTAVTGFLVHFVLSAIYGVLLVAFIRTRNKGTSILVSLVFGLALYLINFYGFTMVYSWFEEARGWITILSHLVFGLIAGYAYKVFQEKYQCETC